MPACASKYVWKPLPALSIFFIIGTQSGISDFLNSPGTKPSIELNPVDI